MAKKEVIQIRVSEEWKQRLTEEAKKSTETPSEYMRKAAEKRWEHEKDL